MANIQITIKRNILLTAKDVAQIVVGAVTSGPSAIYEFRFNSHQKASDGWVWLQCLYSEISKHIEFSHQKFECEIFGDGDYEYLRVAPK